MGEEKYSRPLTFQAFLSFLFCVVEPKSNLIRNVTIHDHYLNARFGKVTTHLTVIWIIIFLYCHLNNHNDDDNV